MSGEPEVHAGEIARVLRLYAGPAEPQAIGTRVGSSRAPGRLLLGLAVALAAAGAATAVVLGVAGEIGRDRTHAALAPGGCVPALTVDGSRYVERALGAGRLRPGRSLGNGVLRPCGSPAGNVAAVALAGIDARRAVGVRGVQTRIYVAPLCARAAAARLLRCLRAPR